MLIYRLNIALNIRHWDIDDQAPLEAIALLVNENRELRDRGMVNPSHALNGADGASLHQELENLLGFVERGVRTLQGLLPGFLERLLRDLGVTPP